MLVVGLLSNISFTALLVSKSWALSMELIIDYLWHTTHKLIA